MKKSPIKRSRKKLRKLSPITALKRKAWSVFSLWVRKRDNWTCITCGKREVSGQIHAGHLFHGDWMDFIEENINAQCQSCNYAKNRSGREISAIYTLGVDKKYGAGTAERLEEMWRKRYAGLRRSDFEKIIQKYSIK